MNIVDLFAKLKARVVQTLSLAKALFANIQTHIPTQVPIYIGLFAVLFFAFILSLSVGSVAIPPAQIVKILMHNSAIDAVQSDVVLLFRLPRVLTAFFVGAALSMCGVLMQTLFLNPLAGPDVLGISAGASLGVALVILVSGALFNSVGIEIGAFGLTGAAIIGAAFVMFLILTFSLRILNNITLLVIGLMLAGLISSVVSLLQYFASPAQTQAFVVWTFGSLGSVTWQGLGVIIPLVIGAIFVSLLLTKPLNMLQMGETYAKSMGLNVKSIKYILLVLVCTVVGCITAYCGPIAFIGIAVPHLARILFAKLTPGSVLPVATLLGAIVLVFCDMCTQLPFLNYTLPINAVTSLIGAPVVIYVMLVRHEAERNVQGGRFN